MKQIASFFFPFRTHLVNKDNHMAQWISPVYEMGSSIFLKIRFLSLSVLGFYFFGMSLLGITLFGFNSVAQAQCTLELKVEGAVGSATVDYIQRGIHRASELQCESILMILNTPGGSLESTRIIVEKILNSEKPFLCLVAPQGAHAGSAGAIILNACHVNGALKATNIGAATPVTGTGEELGQDMRNKLVNDTVSWLEGMTKLRGRNLDFAKKIVTEAKAVSSEEAFKIKAIDILSEDVKDFLVQAGTKTYKNSTGEDVKVLVSEVEFYPPDSRYKLLQFFAHPQISYLLFMASLAFLYFEITHPGTIVPGVVGAIGLIISLINFHMLEVSWGGLALIILGIFFLILEAFVTSFGMLGIGGVLCFVLGGVFLFDPATTAYSLPLLTILPTALVLGGALTGTGYLLLRTRKLKVQTGSEEMLDRVVTVKTVTGETTGTVKVLGENWRISSTEALEVGDSVVITRVEGLTLMVRKK